MATFSYHFVKVPEVIVDFGPEVLGLGHHVRAHGIELLPGGGEEGVLPEPIPGVDRDQVTVGRHFVGTRWNKAVEI